MKTNNVYIYLLLTIVFFSCNNRNVPEFIYIDESMINGQLCYLANPFAPTEDTVLVLNNAFIDFTSYNSDYYSYVRDLLTLKGGKCVQNEIESSLEYMAESTQYFYPICGKELVSLIDSETGRVVDSILLNDRTIYLKRKRNGDTDYVAHFYMGDFVWFIGSDYMKPKFITDSITPSGEQIICFDGQHSGPFQSDSNRK